MIERIHHEIILMIAEGRRQLSQYKDAVLPV